PVRAHPRPCACLLLSSYVHPPHLPSFPTRRSSDLALAALVSWRRWRIAHLLIAAAFTALALLARRNVALIGPGVLPLVASGPIRDRKSTRLNSSHGSISYAVFCLKKKNKQTRRVVG